jgi:hypothetical protein
MYIQMGRGHFTAQRYRQERHSQSSLPQETRMADSAREATSLLMQRADPRAVNAQPAFESPPGNDPVMGSDDAPANEWFE